MADFDHVWTRMRAAKFIGDSNRQADHNEAADQALGRMLREALDARQDGAGTQLRDDLIAPACLSTAERRYQDRLLAAVTGHLMAIVPSIHQEPADPHRDCSVGLITRSPGGTSVPSRTLRCRGSAP